MRYLLPVQASLAGLLLLPALAGPRPQGSTRVSGVGAFERALEDTVRALEELAGLRDRLTSPAATQDESARAIAAALRSTEAPSEAGPALDERLALLRDEVARLEQLLGELVVPDAGALVAGTIPLAPRPTAGGEDASSAPKTIGLDDGLRAELAGLAGGARRSPASPFTGASGKLPRAGEAFEVEGYAADSLRLARALYRAGRFEEALRALPAEQSSPEGRWWRGRLLERLGQLDEADTCWRELATDANAEPWNRRARTDLDFLEWKRSLDLPARATGPVEVGR